MVEARPPTLDVVELKESLKKAGGTALEFGLLLRKLKVVEAGPPMAAAELKESLKKAKVLHQFQCFFVIYVKGGGGGAADGCC